MGKKHSRSSVSEVGLSEVLAGIRDDLAKFEHRTPDWDPLFEITGLEVELLVRVKTETTVEGGIKAYIVAVGGKGNESLEQTHRIRLTLKAADDASLSRKPEVLRGTAEGRRRRTEP